MSTVTRRGKAPEGKRVCFTNHCVARTQHSAWLIVKCVCLSLTRVQLFVTPWAVSHQAPLSMGILRTRILEWVAMTSSRGSSQPRDRTQVSCIAGGFITDWATREARLSKLKAKRCMLSTHSFVGDVPWSSTETFPKSYIVYIIYRKNLQRQGFLFTKFLPRHYFQPTTVLYDELFSITATFNQSLVSVWSAGLPDISSARVHGTQPGALCDSVSLSVKGVGLKKLPSETLVKNQTYKQDIMTILLFLENMRTGSSQDK